VDFPSIMVSVRQIHLSFSFLPFDKRKEEYGKQEGTKETKEEYCNPGKGGRRAYSSLVP
jgi:hypothetical protein